jgi:hypothetical protein
VNNITDTKLENTSLSTDVVQGSLNEISYFQRYKPNANVIGTLYFYSGAHTAQVLELQVKISVEFGWMRNLGQFSALLALAGDIVL